jgi:5-methylcytosine-specific restriction protein A
VGKGFIEVHHIKPLFSLDEEVNVNAETDLVPVCSNCHRIIHRKKNAILTVEELTNSRRIAHIACGYRIRNAITTT